MKKIKKILCTLLVAVMVVCFVGCTSPEEKVAEYVEILKEETEKTASNEFIDCTVEARGTAVVYKCYVKDASITEEMSKALFEKFDNIQDEIKTEFNESAPEITSVIYEIYDPDKKLFDSKEYPM